MARFPTASAALPVVFAFTSLLSSTVAARLTALEPREVINEWSEGWPRCYNAGGHKCPGLWPSSDPTTDPTLNDTMFTSIFDAGLLAKAALDAIDAPHFDYFFERNNTVTTLAKTVFTNIAACAEGRDCRFGLLFPEAKEGPGGWCKNTPNPYSYAPGGNTQNANLGGGVIFLCSKGLKLARNPTPCTTEGPPSISLGYAVLRSMVQSSPIRDPTNEGTLFDGLAISAITEMENAGDWALEDLGWGIVGDGLMGDGVGNAANWAAFASLSWDLGYGSAPWTGETCEKNWTKFAAAEGLVPIS